MSGVVVKAVVQPNSYYDSLVLMRISCQVMEQPGVVDATVMMGTDQNKHSIGNPALLTATVRAAGPNDLFFAVAAETEMHAQAALAFAAQALVAGRGGRALEGEQRTRTLEAALRQQPASNLAVLSIPGPYVRREALKALDAGLNLLIFSDNVPLDVEIELKRIAEQRDLLVMGPDCGTAIIGGVALAFANAVRRGPIGLVGASGTGLQEVSCLVDRLGQGVSHAIGTGTHDVDEAVGGVTMLQGLQRLQMDPDTEVVVVVSKPPAAAVVHKVMAAVQACSKPVVVNFLGSDPQAAAAGLGIIARTLEDAAVAAVALTTGEDRSAVRGRLLFEAGEVAVQAAEARAKLIAGQQYVRGLFSGGTFANEATIILCDLLGTVPVYTNGGIKRAKQLPDPRHSQGHTCVDLGEDVFTVGRPHPMLEPSLRRERFLAEAADPETAVILVDVPIGYGVHPDPAGLLADIIDEAKALALAQGRELPVVAHVCGVDADPQTRFLQVQKLQEAGALVMPSNAQATLAAVEVATGLLAQEGEGGRPNG